MGQRNIQMARTTSSGFWMLNFIFMEESKKKISWKTQTFPYEIFPFFISWKMFLSQLLASDWGGSEGRCSGEVSRGTKVGRLVQRPMCYCGIHSSLTDCLVTMECTGAWKEKRSQDMTLRFTRESPQSESHSCFPPFSLYTNAYQNQGPLSTSARHTPRQDRKLENSLCAA